MPLISYHDREDIMFQESPYIYKYWYQIDTHVVEYN